MDGSETRPRLVPEGTWRCDVAMSPIVANALRRALLAGFIAALTVFMDEVRRAEERERDREKRRK